MEEFLGKCIDITHAHGLFIGFGSLPILSYIGRSLPATQREEREREENASLRGEGEGAGLELIPMSNSNTWVSFNALFTQFES